MSKLVLQLKSIERSYKQSGANDLEVLKNVNLNIRRGEIVALVGASGSGKSTLLQIAGLLDSASSGEVIINDINASKADDRLRTNLRLEHIGFVYQFHNLLPEFTALENVIIPQMIAKTSHKAATQRAKELLEQLGLAKRLNHRPTEMSGGEQQRVAIARALANNPALLLADEPTGNLDPVTANKVFELFMDFVRKQNVAALIATHNLELAQKMDKVFTLASA